VPPIHLPLRRLAATLSRTRSADSSLSNWAKESRTFRVNRPMDVVVLNCWVTATNETDLASKASTSFAKSASERVRRSIFLVSHFLNHALGNISMDALAAGVWYHTAFWQFLPVAIVFYTAALVHAGLGIWALYERRQFRWKAIEPLTIDDHGARQSEQSRDGHIADIEAHVPTLVEARVLVEGFQAMVRKKLIANFDPWIASASSHPQVANRTGVASATPTGRFERPQT
jgi:hypothetical protein